MTKTLCCVLLAAMYGCPGPEPAAIKPGNGIKVDASGTISIDDAIVPTGANCSTGEVLQRTASGWACTASAPDAAQLGGKPAAAYLTSGATVSNASNLEGHAASYFLPTGSKAADSAMLNGHPQSDFLASTGTAVNASHLNGHTDADFLAAGATAVNSSAVGGHPASDFLAAGGTAANSAQLNGQPASSYLSASGTAANSAKLNGQAASFYLSVKDTAANSAQLGNQPPSYYLAASATAADASMLGGVAATNYARADQAATMKGALTIQDANDSGTLRLGGDTAGVFGSNVAGNLHLDSDDTKSDGHIYLNWIHGNGVRFGDGGQTVVAEMDKSGNFSAATVTSEGTITASGDVSAPSFNGLQVSLLQVTNTSLKACKDVCASSSGSCLAAKAANGSGPFGFVQCTDPAGVGFRLKCYCASF